VNKTKIEWTDYTWNPVTGCLHGCDYCYARRLAKRFAGRNGYPVSNPFQFRYHADRLDEPGKAKNPSRIFVCSMGDLFGAWVPGGIIRDVIHPAWMHPRHTFQFLTKAPSRYARFKFPPNAWLGFSAPDRFELDLRKRGLWSSAQVDRVQYVSLEPIRDRFSPQNLAGLDWVIVGGQTGAGAKAPDLDHVQSVIDATAQLGIPCFVKDNCRVAGPREFPEVRT